jgi:hypothetical protein
LRLKTSLNSPGVSLTSHDQDLHLLADRSVLIADEPIADLDRLKVTANCTKFKSFKQAVKTIWSKKKLEDSIYKLRSIREQLQFRVVVDIKCKVDLLSIREDARWRAFDDATRATIEAIVEFQSGLATEIRAQRTELFLRLDQSDAAAVQRHKETLATLQNPIFSRIYCSSRQDESSLQQDLRKAQKKILNKLDFRQRMDRHEDITKAHEATFEWLYGDLESSNTSWVNFSEWLRSGTGIYWINGKAG